MPRFATSLMLGGALAALPGLVCLAQEPASAPATVPAPSSASTPAAQATPPNSPPPATAPGPFAPPGPATSQPTTLKKVVVSSDLDLMRDQIAPALGAVTYTVGPEQIQNIPGGENATLQQLLLRAPGVVLDSFGQEHVRGEHANLTYRVNGVLLPQPLSGFAQEIDSHLIQSLTLIDGSLPAQFGLHTAGIVDITTKSGDTLQHNELSLYGGSNDTFEPSFQLGGSQGKFDYFVTGSGIHNDLGIENPDDTHRALHDYTNQEKFFGYFNFRLDDTSRLSILVNSAYADFQIPDTAGLAPAFALAGHPAANSAQIDENQHEVNQYAVLAYQKGIGDLNFQLSGFTSYGKIYFSPDVANDLLFQGVAGRVINSFITNGMQFDASYNLNDQHTIRAGFIGDYTCESLDTGTAAFLVDPNTGSQLFDTPLSISDNTNNGAMEAGIYLQDEWRLTEDLTFNYGLRYDRFDATFDDEGQLSPRANLVWKIDDKTTAHAGYARYFVPPPVKTLGMASLEKFAGTTNAPENFLAGVPKVERSHYFDVGISRQITKPWQITLDGYYKLAHNLVDEGQFGAPVILSAFNYRHATVYGAELSSTYKQGGLSLFQNFSFVETAAHDIDSQQYLIANDELAYIVNHDIHLDHESEFTVSAGAAYQWKYDRVYVDFLLGSGLRSGFANTQSLSPYYPVNVGYEHIFQLNDKNSVRLRFDVVNIFDQQYEIRNGSGIGVGAPQFGQRLGFYGGITYTF